MTLVTPDDVAILTGTQPNGPDAMRALREKTGLLSCELADLLRISREYMSRLEHGILPPSRSLEKLLRAVLAAQLGLSKATIASILLSTPDYRWALPIRSC